MNEDAMNLINSFSPSIANSVKVGGTYMYREGIIKARVKVLEKEVTDDWLKLKLEVIGDTNYAEVGDVFPVSVKRGCENVPGIWRLLPLVEQN